MGRILDALTLPSSFGQEPLSAGPDLSCLCLPSPASETEGEEEIPFIEVGPRKSMEASASVLACAPPPSGGPTLTLSPEAEAAVSSPPEPARADPVEVKHTNTAPARMAPELITYHRPEHAVSQQYQRLLEPLLASAAQGQSPALLFSAARPKCGTTTVLLNVAIAAARQSRRRVVVVDGNLRHPALAERLGLADGPGLREVLYGVLVLDRAVRETDQANLFALTAGTTAGPSVTGNGIRVVAQTMRSLLRQLRRRFDLVLVDGPRWDSQPDVVALGTACDAIYLVVAEGEAESSQVDDLYLAIPEQGGRLAGCILSGC